LSAVNAVAAARKAAFAILMEIERGRAHADELLRGKAVSALAAADRNLATAIVLGVLRWQILLDEQTKKYLKRPGAKLDAAIRIALRMGVFQLWFLDRIPDHAAIGESVELVKQAGHNFASRMVNAVLRNAARAGFDKNLCDAAIACAYPAWMAGRWTEFYGSERALALCRHGQAQPQLALRIASPGTADEIAAAGVQLGPGSLLAAARTVIAGDATATEAFREGLARVQDEGSQLIGELAACACCGTNPKPIKILDACAAPGGKTLILAERNPAARILACEANPRRLAQLKERMAGCAACVECRLADAAALEEDSVFDLALVDAPCSGTGTLGRNPEIRYRLRLEDLARQAERQRAILSAALRAVRSGGRVLYSTCSLEPEENEQVVAAMLAERAGARQISLAPQIEALVHAGILTAGGAERIKDCLTVEGALRLLPGAVPTDGFFAALIEKR
jgi:16S rRNA (cytosine967-C5)-methyltransferase